jgi:ankyrin repeat protein
LILLILLLRLAAVADSEGGLLPIHLAARDGLADVLGLLLRKSDINAQDKNGQTPLHLAGIAII